MIETDGMAGRAGTSQPIPRGFALLALALGLTLGSRGSADSIAIVATRDNSLFQDAAGGTSNGIGPLFAGNNSLNRTRRGLVRFDVAAAVPADAHIDSVVLKLIASSAPDSVLRLFTLHRVLGDWGEGSSYSSGGTGAPATPMDATWLHAFYPSVLWLNAGGDFAAAPSAALTAGGLGSYEWRGAGMNTDAQGWLAGSFGDFGWLVHGDEGGASTARRFESRESSTAEERPTLTVYYTASRASVGDRLSDSPRLGAVFPNPARGATRASLALAKPTVVRVWIEDALGRRVATLANGPMESGRHELGWTTRDDSGRLVAPGVYSWRAAANGRLVVSRRCALVR